MFKALLHLTRLLPITLLLLVGFSPIGRAQVVCNGSFGDPVVNITFGSGSNPGPALKASTTNYQYVTTSCPSDGQYTVTTSTLNCFGSTWHSITSDHTGNPNGYFMLINASYQPSDFYLDTVKGLCANTTYRFAAWVANILVPNACNGNGHQPNITFKIEPVTGGTPLATVNTGDIPSTNSLSWIQYFLDFTTTAGSTEVVLRMTNNAPGDCGNDLALDDITFSPCGPRVTAGITTSPGSSSASFCIDAQSPVAMNGSVSVGYNAPDYQWQVSTDTGKTWTDIPGATTTTYTRPVSADAGQFLYRMAVSEGGNIITSTCRVASNLITVTVDAKPVPVFANNSPVCEGGSATIIADGGVQYSWTGPNGFISTDQSIHIDNIPIILAGDYHVTVTSAAGCTQTAATTLVVYPYPSAAYNTSAPLCEHTSIGFTDFSNAAPPQTLIKWKYDFGDGSVDSTHQNTTHIFTTPGTYTVTLYVTSDKGCTSQPYNLGIPVYDLPMANFGTPAICLADPIAEFHDSSTIADGTGSSFLYIWNFGDANAAPADNTSTQKDATHKYTAAGDYTVHLTVSSANGCVKDTLKTFTVNGDNPIPAYTMDHPSLLCSNAPVILHDASSVTPGNIIKTEINWDAATKTTDDDPFPGKIYDHSYPYFSTPASQTYNIRYTVYSGQTCKNQIQQTITINAAPHTLFFPPDPVCEEIQPYLITTGAETEGFAGTAHYTGRGIEDDGTFTPRIARPGVDTLYYIFNGSNGCSDTSKQTIRVYPQPHADAGPTVYMLEGATSNLDGSGSGNNIGYAWSPADSIIDNPHIPAPKIAPHDDLLYTLTVTSADGCTDSSKVQVVVLKIPIVPNAFSPNGDGINDTWIIRYLDEYPSADIQVFNRYGQPVYHATGYTRPWDGTYNGHQLPIGTYYWIINPRNGRRQITGSVTIIR